MTKFHLKLCYGRREKNNIRIPPPPLNPLPPGEGRYDFCKFIKLHRKVSRARREKLQFNLCGLCGCHSQIPFLSGRVS